MNFSLIKGHVVMLCANVMWGLMAPIAKMVLATGLVSSLFMTDCRIFGAAILFWIASLFTRYEKVPPKDLLLLAGAGLLGILFNQGCYIFGIGLTYPGEASIITTTMPLWVMVFAALILREPITLKKIFGIILGASGALILVFNGAKSSALSAPNPMLGDILVLIAQLSYALYLTFYRNFIRKYSVFTLMKWMFTFASLSILPFSINEIFSVQWAEFSLRELLGIGYVVICGTFLAYIFVMIGQKNLRPTVVGMYNYVQPIVATTVGIAIGLDIFTVYKALAILFIFTGVYLVTISKATPQYGTAR